MTIGSGVSAMDTEVIYYVAVHMAYKCIVKKYESSRITGIEFAHDTSMMVAHRGLITVLLQCQAISWFLM